jgi:hypothetical protein
LDRFVELDFDAVCFLEEDLAAVPVFDGFFAECDFF